MNELDRMINRQAAKAHQLRLTVFVYRKKAKEAEEAHDAQAAANWNALADQMAKEYNQTFRALKAFKPLQTSLSLAEQDYLMDKAEGRNKW